MAQWWELYAARIPDGANLVGSKATPGLFRGFFLGADGITGHGEFAKIDLRKPAVAIVAVSLAAGVIGTVVVMHGAPRAMSWWKTRAVPGIQKAVSDARHRDPPRPDADEPEFFVRSNLADFTKQVDEVLQDSRKNMTSAEAQRKGIEILMAASIIADRLRALSDAKIQNEAEFRELSDAIKSLSAQDVTDEMNRILESNSSLLDDDTSSIFANVFRGGFTDEGEYIPIQNDNVRSALEFPGLQRLPPEAVPEEDQKPHPVLDDGEQQAQ
jgi:hypothetical protein